MPPDYAEVGVRRHGNLGQRDKPFEDIFKSGLHEFLADFIDQNSSMSDEIATSYLN
jgi:uncharacterized alpha-E superfamily protein